MKSLSILAVLLASALPATAAVAQHESGHHAASQSDVIAAAIADPNRPAADRDRDALRHPGDLLAFTGIKPGDAVIDVWPGGGYWTRLFSAAVGPKGSVTAYVPAEIVNFGSKPLDVARAFAAEPGRGNVTVVSDPLADPAPPAIADIIWTSQNYHDLHNIKDADVAAFNREVFRALRPGGVYIVIDHAAPAGSGVKNTADLHRIDPETVKAEAKAAGFVLESEGKMLANPADPHDIKVFDPAIRGKTDQFVFKFRKPK
ncbi:MAG: hypothetical protein ABS87_06360 [Sphingomonas sp. SCN 67-18]|uniref:class I SAM-dependent methyltransferase n=1 Tax=uncultured Sphingomonas sp. TaxID=158754 RepID=UPI00086EE3DE|nr:class I SAM-dependent methyltransferase [Sphingomonas sp. SCN 67-18]ODU21451.1 MAG: hypothetical protein ABS87_06360 [Sphingomonas sp. SCN 67-18]